MHWQCGSASGICATRGRDLICAIRGTDDKLDARQDIDLSDASARAAAFAHGIKSHAAPGARVHQGFVTHALLSLHGIGGTVNIDDYETVWITGHSLGGAASALIVDMIDAGVLDRCRVFTFGAPATHSVLREQATGPRIVRVTRTTDPVPSLPPGYQHRDSVTLHLRYQGCVRTTPGAFGTLCRWLYLFAGAASLPLRAAGYQPRWLPRATYAGHFIEKYITDLEPFQ